MNGRPTWRELPESSDGGGGLRAVYARLDAHVRAHARTPKEARSAVNHLFAFVCAFLGDRTGDLDRIRVLPAEEQVVRAEATWTAMQCTAKWGRSYLREVRTSLSRALLAAELPSAAYVVNPALYRGALRAEDGTRFRVSRSQQKDFSMHECLP